MAHRVHLAGRCAGAADDRPGVERDHNRGVGRGLAQPLRPISRPETPESPVAAIAAPMGDCRPPARPPDLFGVPRVRALNKSTYFAGLRKAGMPGGVSTRPPPALAVV